MTSRTKVTPNPLQKLSRDAKYLRNLLGVYIVFAIFLTPIGGLETRSPSNITAVGFATLTLFVVGLALNAASLVLIFLNPRRSPVLSIVGSVLYFPVVVADQAGFFSSLSPPLGIDYLEALEGFVAIIVIFLAVRARSERPGKAIVTSAAENSKTRAQAVKPVLNAIR